MNIPTIYVVNVAAVFSVYVVAFGVFLVAIYGIKFLRS